MQSTRAVRPAHTIAYQQCDDCKRAIQNGAGRSIDVSAEVIERVSCDARILGSLDAATPARAFTTVTPRMREQVFARDGYVCAVPGCRCARNLEVHHIIALASSGRNELWNLLLLCSGHHSAHHAGLLEIVGRAPFDVRIQWKPAMQPLPPRIDDAARELLISRRIDALARELVPRGTLARIRAVTPIYKQLDELARKCDAELSNTSPIVPRAISNKSRESIAPRDPGGPGDG